ncbi:MAG TPA: MarR family transcriptional regulator [Armatimonadota bacterium]|jgi:hypothetical protein
MNEAHWNADERPPWLDEQPEEERERYIPATDGFRGSRRRAPALSSHRVSDDGAARHWQFHPALLTVKPLMLLTHLSAHGPTTTMDICAAFGIDKSTIGRDLKRLQWVSLVAARSVPSRLGARTYHAHSAREWSITDAGRQALWRMGWVTRDVLHEPWEDAPLRDDVEDDPVEAVRRHGVFFWLRPCGLQVARVLTSRIWTPASMRKVARLCGINMGMVWNNVQYMHKRGWLKEHPDMLSHDFRGKPYPALSMNDAGIEALGRHVDALRRAGRSTGWTLDPDDPAYAIVDERGEFPYCWEPEAARLGWKL